MIAFQDACFWGTVNHHNQWSTALLSFLRLVRLTIKDSPPHHKTLISQLSILVKMNKINHKSAKLVYNPTIYNAYKSTNGICIIVEHSVALYAMLVSATDDGWPRAYRSLQLLEPEVEVEEPVIWGYFLFQITLSE